MPNTKADSIEDKPITMTELVKWGAVLATICTTLVSLVWFIASIKQDQALTHEDLTVTKKVVNDNKLASDKAIEDMRLHQTSTDKAVDELNRKLDVATTILQRIDAKLKQP